MKRGRAISLFLLDGSVTGAIKYTMPNWTGVVYKIPRTALGSCKNREHLQQSGVYFLFGKSEERNENIVYVGQAGIRKNGNGLLGRILEHARNPEKEYSDEQQDVVKLVCPHIAETQTILFQGIEINAPKNPEQYLAVRYGENWRIPDKKYIYWKGPSAVLTDYIGYRDCFEK